MRMYGANAAIPAEQFARVHEPAGPVTVQALDHLRDPFAAGPGAAGSVMAGRAEEGVGEPETVVALVAVLAEDLLAALDDQST